MHEQALAFFEELINTPGPSGYEQPVQAVVRRYVERFADEVRTDLHGNLIAIRNPTGQPRILLDGHCDQIGLLIQHIDPNGFLYFNPIGGWDAQILLGQSVQVWTDAGPIPGVIARKPKHLLSESEMKTVPDLANLWIDIGARDRSQAESLVKIGDPVTPRLGMRRLQQDFVSGAKMDDAAGLLAVVDVLRRLHGQQIAPAVAVVSAVQEEIGLRGAHTATFGVDPVVGIAVDVTHATDCPTIDQKEHGKVEVGKGPVLFRGPNVNPKVLSSLQRISREKQLPTQLKAIGKGTANDANAIQLSRAGVAAGCIGIPNRYMHSPVEVVSLSDLDVTSELLAEFIRQTPVDADFRPW